MPKKIAPPDQPLALRDACIVAAQEVIAERGIENLSLREVARKLGVSHQAPYKHYPSRDHLLAEVMRRCFEGFAAHLDGRQHHDDPNADLNALGQQYLSYAEAHPLEYRLMFSTPWPESAEHPDLVRDSARAFDILRQVMRRMHGNVVAKRDLADLDALYIWSSMHGTVGIMHGDCIDKLDLKAKVRRQAMAHVMEMVSHSLATRTG
jgi:AcrR family transcriptional regulator